MFAARDCHVVPPLSGACLVRTLSCAHAAGCPPDGSFAAFVVCLMQTRVVGQSANPRLLESSAVLSLCWALGARPGNGRGWGCTVGGTSGPACRDALLVLGGRHAQILVPLGRRVRGAGALRRRSPLAPRLPAIWWRDVTGAHLWCSSCCTRLALVGGGRRRPACRAPRSAAGRHEGSTGASPCPR